MLIETGIETGIEVFADTCAETLIETLVVISARNMSKDIHDEVAVKLQCLF